MKTRHDSYRGHIPFVRFLLALLTGIGCAYALVPTPGRYTFAWILIVITLLAFIGIAWMTRLRQQRYYGWLGLLILTALAATGCVLTWQSHPSIAASHFSRHGARVILGYVDDEPVIRGGYLRVPFAVTDVYDGNELVKASGRLMLTVPVGDSLEGWSLDYGDELILPADDQEVPPPYNPGERNYKSYLANQGMWHQAYIAPDEVEKIGEGKGNPLIASALALRKRMVAKFSRHITDRDARAVAATLILGYRADLEAELLRAFSATGTIHILSVSGMHVIMVCWVMAKLLWWMGRNRTLRRVRFIVLLTAVWGYALLTGFSPSVLRAAIMISFVIAATALGRRNRIYNSIAASAFFLLLYHPPFIADIGFQLSYLAVTGIVFLHPRLQRAFPIRNRLVKPISDYTWMSVAAQVGAGPLAAYYFHQFPLYFLFANLFIVLPASGIMYLGFALLMMPSGPIAAGIGAALEELILLVNAALRYIEQLPKASIQGIYLTWWQSLLIYLMAVAVTLALTTQRKRWVYGSLTVISLLVFASFVTAIQRIGHREVIIFNVRRALAIGFIADGEAWVYSNLDSLDDRTIRYAVRPKLEASVPLDAIHFVSQDSQYRARQVYINRQILQFGGTRLMVYDGEKIYNGQLDVDVLLIRNNPAVSLDKLLVTIRCKQLVVDGSNYDSTISRLKDEANAAGIPLYVLKNNVAYTWAVLH
ncbi:ComEC/Rec2 family competence protein [Parapedobacter sp. DT-150]|uniref:ComEC/Rec2 family competence protein n=1 Tax=Parapedobacter sp. DT-150 TaxID=3396162 RepID=UPI003F1E32D9